ncbi:MAG: hypothetical protein ISR90_07050 [Candidatus Marinimicrobia bacterium]|nr:hypothetical protein [Candidatus Neomarinimicrobiota bacterium]
MEEEDSSLSEDEIIQMYIFGQMKKKKLTRQRRISEMEATHSSPSSKTKSPEPKKKFGVKPIKKNMTWDFFTIIWRRLGKTTIVEAPGFNEALRFTERILTRQVGTHDYDIRMSTKEDLYFYSQLGGEVYVIVLPPCYRRIVET